MWLGLDGQPRPAGPAFVPRAASPSTSSAWACPLRCSRTAVRAPPEFVAELTCLLCAYRTVGDRHVFQLVTGHNATTCFPVSTHLPATCSLVLLVQVWSPRSHGSAGAHGPNLTSSFPLRVCLVSALVQWSRGVRPVGTASSRSWWLTSHASVSVTERSAWSITNFPPDFPPR